MPWVPAELQSRRRDSLAPAGWRVGPRRPLPASPSSSPQGAGRKPDRLWLSLSASLTPPRSRLEIPCTNTGLLPSGGNSKSSSFFYSCPHLCRQRGGKTNPAKSPRAPAVWQCLLRSSRGPSGSHRPGAESHLGWELSAPLLTADRVTGRAPAATGQVQRVTISGWGVTPSLDSQIVSQAELWPKLCGPDIRETKGNPAISIPGSWEQSCFCLTFPSSPRLQGFWAWREPGYLFQTLSQMRCGCPGCQLRDHWGKEGQSLSYRPHRRRDSLAQ